MVFIAGLVTWTLIEYAGHRWLMHGPLWTKHRIHHVWAGNNILLPLFVVVPCLLILILVSLLSLSLASGILAGYVYYEAFHCAAHWWKMPWHERHHVKSNKYYGVTSVIWDKVFRTA